MFTGLVKAIGRISHNGDMVLVEIPESFPPVDIGDSISVDGVCLTASSIRYRAFLADISEETLKRTVLGMKASKRQHVNLEPALRLSDRLGGHLVSGHVDGLGEIVAIEELPHSWHLRVRWKEKNFSQYTCDKASIALNGISLTVSKTYEEGREFSIAVISHSWNKTSLKYLEVGDVVNLESDLMAKYAERLLKNDYFKERSNTNQSTDLSEDWLVKNGFF